MPALTLLAITDSFAAEWPKLAAECGLELTTVTEAASFDRRTGTIGIVSAAGDEEQLESALLEMDGGRMPIAAVGARPDHRIASAVVRAGAAEYFALPGDHALLRSWLREQGERLRAQSDASAFAAGERAKYRFEGILGESKPLHAALERAARVIPHGGVTVLITGETGTGKELLARAIHYDGPRRSAPFVDVNCAAIPENLLESELFGHEKGAFTSATSTKPGLFELASGGTIFLDEIGHLALPLQGKVLRALEERAIRRVGGTKSISVDVRVVAATHVNLLDSVQRGEFREDLYYRLNVVPLELPPLRARTPDILPLARHFLTRFATEYGMAAPRLTAEACEALTRRMWPGNVRELRNAMERAVLLAVAGEITAADVSEPPHGATDAGALPFPATIADIVRSATVRMVELCGGNKSEAARRLGISRPRLLRLLNASTVDDDSMTDLED